MCLLFVYNFESNLTLLLWNLHYITERNILIIIIIIISSAFFLDKKEPECHSGTFRLRKYTLIQCYLSRKKVPERGFVTFRLKESTVYLKNTFD